MKTVQQMVYELRDEGAYGFACLLHNAACVMYEEATNPEEERAWKKVMDSSSELVNKLERE